MIPKSMHLKTLTRLTIIATEAMEGIDLFLHNYYHIHSLIVIRKLSDHGAYLLKVVFSYLIIECVCSIVLAASG